MNKDDFAKMKSREELVKAFIGKLENVSIKDVEIIPALWHYASTGDETFFKEFCEYHFTLSPEEKQKRVEDAKKRLDAIKEKLDYLKEYQKQYTEAYEKLKEWRSTFADTDIETPSRRGINVRTLKDFLDTEVKELPNWFQKVLYVLDGDDLRRIDHVCIIDKKVVFMMGRDARLLPKCPDLPHIRFPFDEEDDFDMFPVPY